MIHTQRVYQHVMGQSSVLIPCSVVSTANSLGGGQPPRGQSLIPQHWMLFGLYPWASEVKCSKTDKPFYIENWSFVSLYMGPIETYQSTNNSCMLALILCSESPFWNWKCVAYLRHEVGIWRDGQEGTSGEVKVHQDLPEGGPVLGLGLPRKQSSALRGMQSTWKPVVDVDHVGLSTDNKCQHSKLPLGNNVNTGSNYRLQCLEGHSWLRYLLWVGSQCSGPKEGLGLWRARLLWEMSLLTLRLL